MYYIYIYYILYTTIPHHTTAKARGLEHVGTLDIHIYNYIHICRCHVSLGGPQVLSVPLGATASACFDGQGGFTQEPIAFC